MSTYSSRLQPALQNLLQCVVRFFHPRSSCTTMHISAADVQWITLKASCMTISGGRTKHLDIFCRVTGFTSDFLSFIVVELIRFFHGALQLQFTNHVLWGNVVVGPTASVKNEPLGLHLWGNDFPHINTCTHTYKHEVPSNLTQTTPLSLVPSVSIIIQSTSALRSFNVPKVLLT